MNVDEILIYKYPEAWNAGQFTLVYNEDNEIVISKWNVPNVAQPTNEQILSWANDNDLQIKKDIADVLTLLENAINKKSQERGYDSPLSLCTYLTSTNEQWAAEAVAFIKWRDDVWIYAFNIKQAVLSNEIPPPSIEEFIEGLPVLIWPIIEESA